jgi:predicted DNA-binding transcriptional regulator AlpA
MKRVESSSVRRGAVAQQNLFEGGQTSKATVRDTAPMDRQLPEQSSALPSDDLGRGITRARWGPPAIAAGTMRAASEERLLRAVDVAAILSVPTKRVYELGIPGVRLSQRCLRWRRADVERWLEGRRVSL